MTISKPTTSSSPPTISSRASEPLSSGAPTAGPPRSTASGGISSRLGDASNRFMGELRRVGLGESSRTTDRLADALRPELGAVRDEARKLGGFSGLLDTLKN